MTMLLLPLLLAASPVTIPTLTEAEVKKLDAGEMVLHDAKPSDGHGVAAVSMGVIDATSAEVFPIVCDCEHFVKFMPRVKDSSVIVEDGRSLCHTELIMPFPLSNLWSDTVSVIREEPKGHFSREWTLVKGTFTRNSGAYVVVPWGDGKKSLVVYSIDSNPKILIPDAILRSAQTGSLPDVFVAIRKRAAALRSVH